MPSHPKVTDLRALIAELCTAGVEFIVVGGAAAVIQGAPITTNDLDIVHRRTPENVARLLAVMLQLDATIRYDTTSPTEGYARRQRCSPDEDRSISPRRSDRWIRSASSMVAEAMMS